MKLKLDENIDIRIIPLLRLAGYDVATVQEQGLSSVSDREVIDVCRREGRCLVTGDRGFGNRIKLWVIQQGIIQEYEPIDPDNTND